MFFLFHGSIVHPLINELFLLFIIDNSLECRHVCLLISIYFQLFSGSSYAFVHCMVLRIFIFFKLSFLKDLLVSTVLLVPNFQISLIQFRF